MKKPFLSIGEVLKVLSTSEFKIYSALLEMGVGPYPETFEINHSEIAKACNISLPTASKAIQGLINKHVIKFAGRPYKTSPALYSLGTPDDIFTPTIEVFRHPQLPPKKSLSTQTPIISELIRDQALECVRPEHMVLAKEMGHRMLTQPLMRDFYVEHIWQYRDRNFTAEQTAEFLTRVLSHESIQQVVEDFLKRTA